jgi:hypothetical protein
MDGFTVRFGTGRLGAENVVKAAFKSLEKNSKKLLK